LLFPIPIAVEQMSEPSIIWYILPRYWPTSLRKPAAEKLN
jgi:hypothetical protein